jgi:hypothetical protein
MELSWRREVDGIALRGTAVERTFTPFDVEGNWG